MPVTTDSIFGIFDRLYPEIQRILNEKLSVQNFLRAYYLEVSGNLELLAVIREDALTGRTVEDPAFLAFIDRLQISLAAAVIFDEETNGKESAVYNTLRKAAPSVINAIGFTVVKVTLLKNLACFTPEERGLLRGVKIQTRLDNIEEKLVFIKTTLTALEGVREIA
jgi:hypothetical protein